MTTRIFLSSLDWDSDPEHDPRPDIDEAKQAFAAGEAFPVTWTCANIQNIQVGDWAYFKRVGKEPRGFFAKGHVIVAEFQLSQLDKTNYGHLSKAYSDIFDSQFTVDIEWIEVVDYDKPLNTTLLKKKPEFKSAFFDPRRSGSTFNEEYVYLLNHFWEEHLAKSIRLGYGARRN